MIPETRRIVVEHRKVEESFPGLSSASPEEMLERYTLKIGEVERVAGIECQMLMLEPQGQRCAMGIACGSIGHRSAAARADTQ